MFFLFFFVCKVLERDELEIRFVVTDTRATQTGGLVLFSQAITMFSGGTRSPQESTLKVPLQLLGH